MVYCLNEVKSEQSKRIFQDLKKEEKIRVVGRKQKSRDLRNRVMVVLQVGDGWEGVECNLVGYQYVDFDKF